MSFHRLIAPLTVASILVIAGSEAPAQDAFPAPLPGQSEQTGQPLVNGSSPTATIRTSPISPSPSNGTTPFADGGAAGASDACSKEFRTLRAEAEKRGQSIRAASERHAPSEEACKLITSFGQAEINMIKYVEQHATTCAIPMQVMDQLKSGHRNTEALRTKVCALAEQQMQKRGPSGPTGDFWPTSTTPPI
jgi:hypothetical protein